ncbi:MAG: ATP-dependent RNA helicase HrpA [Rubrivivax sp.]|nr:ATP-dependent RNA helicase HrpA [Rubrivivax sp.]
MNPPRRSRPEAGEAGAAGVAEARRAVPPRATPLPPITYPEALPVSARRSEIARALAEHPVIVVSGETGSGKTTQLPKIALELGRGLGAGGRGLIGHTQPRRIAAASVARRIAEELGSPLGEVVGFKVRFQDRLQPGASVKLMTDGILLAETQGDPLLTAYDTLIIDEAHERSLNIDFLLGYLRQILPRRPDLKVVVTSATIDAERFAQHFAGARGPAPVIAVSGRLFPVEQRWRPFEESRDFGLNDALADAVDELWRGAGSTGTTAVKGSGTTAAGPGDILVFLPGEREIREAAEHLRRHLAHASRGGPGAASGPLRGPVEILPLFARLSQAEQDRVFTPGHGRRIVLATNVAETSLTVPGIRYVIDSGVARVKRYSFRNKVEQLLVEPVSQAAANQRAGRCGRVADGVCIRLYDEKDFLGRPRFTDPEILRSSLAGVILRMKSLRLGRVEDFPFLEPPPRKAIADGYALLAELGAVDDDNELTATGRAMAHLPLDPRIGRMILEARERQSLAEVLVIAAALSVPDVRDRPLEQQQAADQKHKPFDDERSEFMGTLALWRWIEAGRGVHGHAAAGEKARQVDQHRLSNRQQEQRLREHFISPRRVREWRDIHAQLHTVVAEQGWRLNAAAATYEQVHLALLAGLLGNIGCKADDDEGYLGARGIRFWRHPGANLAKKPGRWIVAAELVETTRLYGRGIAAIEPQWIPPLAGHLLKKQLLEPHWEKKAGEVVALERATLYGLVVYNNRRVGYALVDAAAAREIFIREALVAALTEPDAWDAKYPFLAHNRRVLREVQELEHKARRQDVLVDETLIEAFYAAQLPADVHGSASFERWYRDAVKREPKLLQLTREELMRHEAAGVTTEAYPRRVRLGGIDCAASYLHEPGDARDGLTVTVPLFALNPVSEARCEWLVPGLLAAKVQALLKSLPQRPRSRLLPLPEFAEAFCRAVPFAEGSLMDALLKAVRERTQLPVQRADFKLEQVPPHLFMNFVVVDEHGRQLGMGRDLAALKAQWGREARSAFQALAALKSDIARAPATAPEPAVTARGAELPSKPAPAAVTAQAPPLPVQRHTAWTFGELPELMEVRRGSQVMVGFPALVDQGDAVTVEVFDEPEVAAVRHRGGLRRLFALQLREPLRYLEKNLPGLQAMAASFMPLGTLEELRGQIVDVALERAFLGEPLPADEAAFKARLEEGRARINLVAQEVARQAAAVLAEYAAATRKLRDAKPPREVADDVAGQLQRLVGRRFLAETPWPQLHHLPRYLRAIVMRLDKLRADPARDLARLAELRPLEQRWVRRQAELRGAAHARLAEYRWLLEELRVGLFAQELRTAQPVSAKRLDKVWAQIDA